MLPCLLFEDEHLLVVNKPAGINTHAPSPFAGEGLYDWLRNREPRWADLAIIHRLDKETSGVIVFTKTRLANQSLTQQFTARTVKKRYLLLTDRRVHEGERLIEASLSRAGDRYVARPGGEPAATRFRKSPSLRVPSGTCYTESGRRLSLVQAEPLTGRTHQIRVHAAMKSFPILGDTLYGGTPAPRLCLHAESIRLAHPASRDEVEFSAPANFEVNPRLELKRAFIDPDLTDAYRVVHGASDGQPGWYVDRLGPYLLSQAEQTLDPRRREALADLVKTVGASGASHKLLLRQVGRASSDSASPQRVLGEPPPERFTIRENGVAIELSFAEGYSVGLFLDQRDNRRRLLTGHVAPDFSLWPESGAKGAEVLNTFAYTCAFSVCAALGGARTTSLDLSKNYLEWGRRNFSLNGLQASEHDFIYGDVFEWLRRLAKKGRRYDVVLLDPPTFSQSKASGVFRAERDYGKLVMAALAVLKPGGVLFASCNAADWPAESFMDAVTRGAKKAGRSVVQQRYFPQPPDFPISRAEPAYLKTTWLRVR